MSDYTTQLRWPVEQRQRETLSNPDDYSQCYSMLGLDKYPIFDESYRAQLNDKIIRHFYFREIGFETLAQFRWYMARTMNENMPYFNQLYNSLNLIDDPITNQKYTWGEVYELEQGGGTTTDTQGTSHDDDSIHKTEDETTRYGKTDDTTTQYGKSDTETTTYGKGDEKVTNYGKTTHDVTTTAYGRSQHTENGGSDAVTEGGTHERVIREDTPMNLIPDGAIENLNYATDVTYTDREGTAAGVTEYGGITDILNGGSDTTTSDGRTGGQDRTTGKLSGSDKTVGQLGGSDKVHDQLGGKDEVETVTDQTSTHDGRTTGKSDFQRELDEHGNRSHNRSGYDGTSPADLLRKYRETFLNVDMQVIASLETLFFGLWN